MSIDDRLATMPSRETGGGSVTDLKPPPGYDSWLEYALAHMETRDLFHSQLFDDGPYWGRTVQRQEFRDAARAELDALIARAQKGDVA
mgnify:CR=1 FL=1